MTKLIPLRDVVHNPHTALTVGTFDGVHAGHKVLINRVLTLAEQNDCKSVIVTFDPHPREIINPGPDGIKLLSTLEERRELLSDLGVNEMIVIPFDRDFSLLSSEDFVHEIIWKSIGVSRFVMGYDHQFGRNREGTIETVRRLGSELGFSVDVVSRQEVEEKTVSSTAIRNTIQEEGNMQLASSFLERYYLLNGDVIHGDKRGRQLGYPTANIRLSDSRKIIPAIGVYAVFARVGKEYFPGMMNIGMRPTFDGDTVRLEAHLFDFDREIYGKEIQIQFVERIRGEQTFENLEALKKQLAEDEKESRNILSSYEPNIAKNSK